MSKDWSAFDVSKGARTTDEGDLKFLAIVCGIEAVNAKYACIWCKCASGDRWDMNKDWSAFDVSKGARTTDEIEKKMRIIEGKFKVFELL
jgi:hypothetical protein